MAQPPNLNQSAVSQQPQTNQLPPLGQPNAPLSPNRMAGIAYAPQQQPLLQQPRPPVPTDAIAASQMARRGSTACMPGSPFRSFSTDTFLRDFVFLHIHLGNLDSATVPFSVMCLAIFLFSHSGVERACTWLSTTSPKCSFLPELFLRRAAPTSNTRSTPFASSYSNTTSSICIACTAKLGPSTTNWPAALQLRPFAHRAFVCW